MFRVFGAKRRLQFALGLGAIVMAVVACAPAPPPNIGSCGLGAFADDASAIESILTAEGAFVAQKNIDALMNLWAADAVVTDAGHTPANTADDRRWRGSDAIYQRYTYRVFPNAPADVPQKTFDIAISGDTAIITGTTRIGDEVSPGGDLWTVRRQSGCWLIQSLTYNREP